MSKLRIGSVTATLAAIAFASASFSCVGARMKIDTARLREIETIVPVAFVSNRYVQAPGSGDGFAVLGRDPTDAVGPAIFLAGIPAFVEAIRRTERVKIFLPDTVLGAKSYKAFPDEPTGQMNSRTTAVAAGGWRFVQVEDREKLAALLDEVDADAALITYWKFSLDARMEGDIGVHTATTHAQLRAWLVGRDGRVAFDDEIDVSSEDTVPIINMHYDARDLAVRYADPIETCAVRLVADLSNARAKARGE